MRERNDVMSNSIKLYGTIRKKASNADSNLSRRDLSWHNFTVNELAWPAKTNGNGRVLFALVRCPISQLVHYIVAAVAGGDWTYVKSQRGKLMIAIGRYRFKCLRVNGPRTYWVCSQVYSQCRASLVSINGEIVKMKNDHNH
ncbi:hypothetical protein EVAR_17949_1 [Eumeta japonica]|uniref:FLYWCH-type domain-containing protein n=1 Tax=Eumeta variegata TaxID=151549 RepID=A0A4C1UYZ9_EUMVA|nr:hypothetical protein EVAR_17949_1 [Eumeta japonica]